MLAAKACLDSGEIGDVLTVRAKAWESATGEWAVDYAEGYFIHLAPYVYRAALLATLLPRCPVYLDALLPCYLAIWLPCYFAALLPCYLASVLPCYLATLIPCHRATLLPCYLAAL